MLVELLRMIDRGDINQNTAKIVLEESFNTGKRASQIVNERGLAQISDEDALLTIVKQVIADNPQAVADYRAGKKQAVGFLTGQIMRQTKGKANPSIIGQLLASQLS
jgi:aspartyl-tRNA(Asn)/glutamyl-tRNA(Gln) amidotransferase subunit B